MPYSKYLSCVIMRTCFYCTVLNASDGWPTLAFILYPHGSYAQQTFYTAPCLPLYPYLPSYLHSNDLFFFNFLSSLRTSPTFYTASRHLTPSLIFFTSLPLSLAVLASAASGNQKPTQSPVRPFMNVSDSPFWSLIALMLVPIIGCMFLCYRGYRFKRPEDKFANTKDDNQAVDPDAAYSYP